MHHQGNVFTLLVLIMLLASFSVALSTVSVAADVSPGTMSTPTPIPTPMLLPDESCATMPCWYELTPGESTAEDVLTFIQQYSYLFRAILEDRDSTFDPETGYMVDGRYIVCWDETVFYTQRYVQHCSEIYINQGVVDAITLAVNRDIFLAEVLDALGSPDQMVWQQGMEDVPFLKLVYVDRSAQVYLESDFATCLISDMVSDFWVYRIEYDALVVPYPPHEQLIPSSEWQAWLAGDVDEPCWVVWRRLMGIFIPTPEPVGDPF